MPRSNAPSYARPGRTEAPAWAILLYLAGLIALGAVGWALIAGLAWLVWFATVYVVTALAWLVSAGVVTLAAVLAVRGSWRGRLVSAVLVVAALALVVWTVGR